ncbi:MAG: zinc-dependent metalloprotease [Gemmatimonadetes bacterium]|nr:zinc-dependent metalloprotease [Gemmatimonadota bacterium]
MRHLLRSSAAALALVACSQPAPAPAPTPTPAAAGARAGGPPSRPDSTSPETPPAGRGGGRGGAAGGTAAGGALAEPNPQPYNRVVGRDAHARGGLFKTIRIGQRLLFEIPRNQLDKDQLLVTEIAKNVLGAGYGGQAVSNRVYRWELRDNRVYLRSVSYEAIADRNTTEYRAVQDANVNPVVAVFNVDAYGPDSSMIVDVTRLFTQPPAELGPGGRIPGTVDAQRSWIESATPFVDNVNVYATLTFAQNAAALGGRGAPAPAPGGRGGAPTNTNPSNTVVMSWSFHRLPDVPMQPRYCDDRVGYFMMRTTDYTDVNDKVNAKCFITRYRLVKKDPSAALSEPVKPIVYYIDPATPKKWVPWFKKAIEDWQPAFEAAGFKNAIIAKEAPDDPDWSPEDARYSVVRWLPSTTENASGPNVHDPRSGEILNAHIQFYQNVQRLQLSWYFTQAAAVDPRARKFPFPDSLMGRLLEYVLAHEVGHTLGFQHNMKASSLYPTDSLRSASFLRQWGHTPTLMDYSRFNYLVQPEDNVPVELLTPVIGPYDKWATMWGYKPIPDANSPEAERATLDAWAREQDTKPWLRFSTQGQAGSDPGDETEAVGDQDAVKATGWGLKNIKREMAYLIPATVNPTEPYDDLDDLYGRLIGQWRTELTHVTNVVGGAESQEKYGSQQGVRFTPVGKARQQAAVKFLNENAFATPTYFLDENILRRIEPAGAVARIVNAQGAILNSLLQNNRLLRVAEYDGAAKGTGYSVGDLLDDLHQGIFSEMAKGEKVDVYRRGLQRAYVEALNAKLNPPPATATAGRFGGAGAGRPVAPVLDQKLSDINPAVRADLRALDAELKGAEGKIADKVTKAHVADLRHRIADALKGKSGKDDGEE